MEDVKVNLAMSMSDKSKKRLVIRWIADAIEYLEEMNEHEDDVLINGML